MFDDDDDDEDDEDGDDDGDDGGGGGGGGVVVVDDDDNNDDAMLQYVMSMFSLFLMGPCFAFSYPVTHEAHGMARRTAVLLAILLGIMVTCRFRHVTYSDHSLRCDVIFQGTHP